MRACGINFLYQSHFTWLRTKSELSLIFIQVLSCHCMIHNILLITNDTISKSRSLWRWQIIFSQVLCPPQLNSTEWLLLKHVQKSEETCPNPWPTKLGAILKCLYKTLSLGVECYAATTKVELGNWKWVVQ